MRPFKEKLILFIVTIYLTWLIYKYQNTIRELFNIYLDMNQFIKNVTTNKGNYFFLNKNIL